MSLADQLLIGWWVAIPIVSISLFLLFRLHSRREQQALTLAYLRGGNDRELRYRAVSAGPIVAFLMIIFLVAAGVLLISFFVILWMRNETNLYLWSFYLLLALVGLGLMARAFAKEPPGRYGPFGFPRMRSYQPKPGSFGAKAMRTLNFVLGSLIFGFTSFLLVEDVALPWSLVEGRIDNVSMRRDRILSPEYKIVIDGRWYAATNEVFSTLRIGDRARAEMGTGSKMIFRAQPISVTPR